MREKISVLHRTALDWHVAPERGKSISSAGDFRVSVFMA
jgi:hypothetical protein